MAIFLLSDEPVTSLDASAYRQVVADLVGHPLHVHDDGELVARGAAVQVAAVLTGETFADVVAAWDLGPAAVIEPTGAVDATAIRGAYAVAASLEPLGVRRSGGQGPAGVSRWQVASTSAQTESAN